MELNFDAVVRLTEALLALLRRSAPSAIVNVASTAGRVARGGSGAYSASKFALAGWSDALYAEEHAHGIHVGLVLPGFVATEGFPQRELVERRVTSWLVASPDLVAEAIVDAGLRGRPERYVPRPYALIGLLRLLTPRLVRRVLVGRGAALLTTRDGRRRSCGRRGGRGRWSGRSGVGGRSGWSERGGLNRRRPARRRGRGRRNAGADYSA